MFAALASETTGQAIARGELDALTDPPKMHLSWAQVGLLLHRLASDAVLHALESDRASARGEDVAVAVLAASARLPLVRTASFDPCGGDDAVNKLIDGVIKLRDLALGEVVDHFMDKAEVAAMAGGEPRLPPQLKRTQRLAKGLGIARAVAGYLSSLARLAALKARFEMDNPPLVRTKDQRPGEVRDLRVTMYIDPSRADPIVKCLQRVLNMAGLSIEIPYPEGGNQAGLKMDLFSEDPSVLRIGDGLGGQ